MTGGPTLLLCVGATKAGTSWLYDHLRAHPDCHLRGIKELHYFDALDHGGLTRELKRHRAAAAELVAATGGSPNLRAAQKLRDLADWSAVLRRRSEDVPAYLAYLTEGAGMRRLVADVTPAYALLSEARLRQMAGMWPDVRFLYLLRDPVARLWSHVRMLAMRATAVAAEVPRRAREILARVLAGAEPGVAARGDYAAAIAKLEAAVAPSRRMVMFQDDLLTPAGLARLWGWLGIGEGVADLSRRVHQGAAVALEAGDAAVARAWLAPQYAFVEAKFGSLPKGWHAPQAGVAA